MKPLLDFYWSNARTVNRLAIYLTISLGTKLSAGLAWLMDSEGQQVRHPSGIWWAILGISMVVDGATIVRAMLDTSRQKDQEAQAEKETNG